MNHVGTSFNSLNFQLIFMAFLSNCFLLQHSKFDLYCLCQVAVLLGFPPPPPPTKWTRVKVGTRIWLTWNRNNDRFCRCVGVPTTAKYALIEWLSIDSMAIQLSQDVGVFWIPQIYMFYWAKTWGWKFPAQVVEHGVQSWLQRAWA